MDYINIIIAYLLFFIKEKKLKLDMKYSDINIL